MRFAAVLVIAVQLFGPTPPRSGGQPAPPPSAREAPPLRGASPTATALPPASGRQDAAGGAAGTSTSDPVAPGGALARLRGGGDEAPLCRSGCAGRFYRCASGSDGGDCTADLRSCRATCDTASQPAGRLVFAPPLTGLPATAPLRGFVSPPAPAPPPR